MPWLEPIRGQMTRAAVWQISSKEPNWIPMVEEERETQSVKRV